MISKKENKDDLKFLRENPDIVKENIKKKFQDHKLPLVDEVIELDEQARSAQQEADALRANRNSISKQIGALMGQGKKDEAMALKEQRCSPPCRVRRAGKRFTGKDYQDYDDNSKHHRPIRSDWKR